MNDYIEVRVDATPCDETITDILASLLCDIGYESFVPDADGLTAYIKEGDYVASQLNDAIAEFPIPNVRFAVKSDKVEGRDWNSEWERNYFQPIVVDELCVIHSSFHTDYPKCTYDIVIDPKMAFGTGHHSTTSLILRRLLATELNGLTITDMGTGTGILAILAAMRGAATINAVEIDEFAHINAVENVRINNHPEINVHLGDASVLPSLPQADIFLANINRNIILDDMPRYVAAMKPGATLLISGFYEEDKPILLQRAQECGLTYITHSIDNRWTCIELRKQQ